MVPMKQYDQDVTYKIIELKKIDEQLATLQQRRTKLYAEITAQISPKKVDRPRSLGAMLGVGRPAGYSPKLGRYLTPEEIKEREHRKMHPRPKGRPVGWRKATAQT